MKSLTDIDFNNKRVLLRLDLDVPIENGKVTDLTRLKAAKETVEFLKTKVANLTICGHIGRPEGFDESLSTKNILADLEAVFGLKIEYINSFWVENFNSQFILLENLRFDKGEEGNDDKFAHRLANNFDYFVNESFATAHRKAASTVGVVKYLESCAGFRLVQEIEHLSSLVNSPMHPFVAIVGGAKIETKLPVIESLVKISDKVLVGGLLPKEISERKIVFDDKVVVGKLVESGMDIETNSLNIFEKEISLAKEIVWNGPIGNFEDKNYSNGTRRLIEMLMNSSAKITLGGGDTISAMNQFGDTKKVYWVCLGGGAMLDYIAGKEMPAIEALR